MQENETAPEAAAATISAPEASATDETGGEQTPEAPPEDITYHAVEKDGLVTAIWEMQGRKHLRTIDPRSRQGQDILRLYTSDHQDEQSATEASET